MKLDFDSFRRRAVHDFNEFSNWVKTRDVEERAFGKSLIVHKNDMREFYDKWRQIVVTLICLESEAEGIKSMDYEIPWWGDDDE